MVCNNFARKVGQPCPSIANRCGAPLGTDATSFDQRANVMLRKRYSLGIASGLNG